MKDIKDYLHLYLGCEVKTYSGRGVLQSFDTDGRWYVQLTNGGGTVGNINDKYKPCPEESKKTFSKGYPPDSILVPILRPLSDMTVGELNEIMNEKYAEPFANEIITLINSSLFDFFKFLSRHGHFDTVPQLLSKGFDLFGLIEAGLAINKSTLKQ